MSQDRHWYVQNEPRSTLVCPKRVKIDTGISKMSQGRHWYVLRLNNDCRSSLACRSLARSLARSVARSLHRSLARLIARSPARSLPRLLPCDLFKANTKRRPSAATNKGGRTAFGRAAPFVVSFVFALYRAHVLARKHITSFASQQGGCFGS